MYVVLLEDDPRHAQARERHMAEHLAFLERNAGRIRGAGPLSEGPRDEPAGGIWIIEAPDERSVRQLVEDDPFWPTGLRKSVRVLRWRRVWPAPETGPR